MCCITVQSGALVPTRNSSTYPYIAKLRFRSTADSRAAPAADLTPGPALGGCPPPPPSLDVGAPNIQYIAFNKYYLCKQNLDIFQQMLTKAFSSAPTQRIKQTDLSNCYVSSYENDFFEIFKNENDSVDSVISNVLAVSLSIHIIERFVSLSSVIVDQ